MSSCSEDITHWKKKWLLTSGTYYELPLNSVKQILMEATAELQDGILHYKKCTTTSVDLEKFLKKRKQHKLFAFTNKLQQLLDLDLNQLWSMFCFYLLNEYRGTAYSLQQYISIENMTKLLDDIWGFYSMERITLLKIVKNLLEFYDNKNHPYYSVYNEIVNKISLKNLRKSYIKQLEYLINENPPNKLTSGEFFDYQIRLVLWSERNIREIIETVQILQLCIKHDGIETKELQNITQLFRQNGFGMQQSNFIDSHNNDHHRDLIKKLVYSEIILLCQCLDTFQSNEQNTNSTWMKDVAKLLDKSISTIPNNQISCGPIFLSWMLFNYQIDDVLEDDNLMKKYRIFGLNAIKSNVFGFLKDLLQHQMFQDSSLTSKIARETIYHYLMQLCFLFNADGSVRKHLGVYELLSELLSWPHIADQFCEVINSNEEGGIRTLYDQAMEYFPLEFIPLSDIFYGLLKSGKVEFVNMQLSHLSTFATIFDSTIHHLKPHHENDDEFILINDFHPFSNDVNSKIKSGTSVILTHYEINPYDCCYNETTTMGASNINVDKQCIHFHTKNMINFYNVLKNEIELLLSETVTYDLNQTRLRRVQSGLNILCTHIKQVKSIIEISSEMIQPIEMCIDVLLKFKNVGQPPIKLFAISLNIFTTLLPYYSTEILTRLMNLNILPNIKNHQLDYKKYAHGISFDSSLVGSYLINIERKMAKYDFLLAYLNFLRGYIKLNKNEPTIIEIPGLVFLLREILPQVNSWKFSSPHDKYEILIEVMRFICEILDQTITSSTDDKENENKLLLRNICLYNLLYLENGHVLLRFIAVGNAYLQITMENETNWIKQQVNISGITLLVRLSMRILMQTLKLKSTICGGVGDDSETRDILISSLESSTGSQKNSLTPLEMLIYTEPKQCDNLCIIPMITSYMNNIFDRWLPIVACRLMRRIALEFNMSLLACLDMEPDHIRLTFLQRLPDNMENDDLKCAILEFIEACIQKQPGLTEAFFKIDLLLKSDRDKQRNFQFSIRDGSVIEKRVKFSDTDRSKEKISADIQQKSQRQYSETATEFGGNYSVLTFMNDYLIGISKDPNAIHNPLYSRVMSIFHALWKKNRQLQIAWDLIKSTPKFWTALCNPLFTNDLKTKSRSYSQLFNILTLELFLYHPIDEITIQQINALISVTKTTTKDDNNSISGDRDIAKKQLEKYDADFKSILNRFCEKETLEKWINHIIINLPNIDDELIQNLNSKWFHEEVPDWLVLLQSFKEFIIVLTKKRDHIQDIRIDDDALKYLCIQTLNKLVERTNHEVTSKYNFYDLRSFIILCELHLSIIVNYKHLYYQSPNNVIYETFEKIVTLLSNILPIYESLHLRARVSCLAVAIEILNSLNVAKDLVMSNFLEPCINIISYELNQLEIYIRDVVIAGKESHRKFTANDDEAIESKYFNENSLILSLNLLKVVTIKFEHEGPDNWTIPFTTNKIIIRLLDCVSHLLQNCSRFKLSLELLDVLCIFAQSQYSNEFLYCDTSLYLWLQLTPPKDISFDELTTLMEKTMTTTSSMPSFSTATALPISMNSSKEQSSSQQKSEEKCPQKWSVHNWWLIYKRGLEFITILLQKHQKHFLKDALLFCGVHEKYLIDALLLSQQTLDDHAMRLIKTVLHLLNELSEHSNEWKLQYPENLKNITKQIQILLDYSISLLYQTKTLKRFVERKTMKISEIPEQNQQQSEELTQNYVDSLIQPMTHLIELIVLCTKFLLKFSPPLLDLICEPEFLPNKWQQLIEVQFGAPKFNIAQPQLTCPTLLSAVIILTKSLNLQNYGFNEAPLNEIPHVVKNKNLEAGGNNVTDSPSSSGGQHFQNQRSLGRASRSPLKSISITSSISIPSVSNELLSNLDEDMCLTALEFVLTFLASQTLLALKSTRLSNRDKQLIRREISNELSSYHDFVRKKVIPDFKDYKSIWQRKKHKIVMMMDLDEATDHDSDSENDDDNTASKKGTNNGKTLVSKPSRSDAMRIKTILRQHARQHQDQVSFESSLSNIRSSTPSTTRKPLLSSTPFTNHNSGHHFSSNENNENFDEPRYSPLSFIEFVEEDYLHFLSNLFYVICLVD